MMSLSRVYESAPHQVGHSAVPRSGAHRELLPREGPSTQGFSKPHALRLMSVIEQQTDYFHPRRDFRI